MDPVSLIKIPFIQYLYGIRSMRQTIKEIEVNVAYRWFIGLELTDPVPHFSTFGKNYTRRFKDNDDNHSSGGGSSDKVTDYTDDVPLDGKEIKCSTTDPESGWFHKGEHKNVFAYGIETACDKNGWILIFCLIQ